MRNLRQELTDGESLIGTWINTASPLVAELMSDGPFDFLVVDAEHSALDLPRIIALFQAIRSGNGDCMPWVRLPSNSPEPIPRLLDAGAQGIIAPLIMDEEQAQRIVWSSRYPPHGKRGVGFSRANAFGSRVEDEISRANEAIVVCIQIEHIDALARLDRILAVEGIDAVLIGPYDLTASLGRPGDFEHSDYLAARDEILAACRQRNIVAGIHIIDPDPEKVPKAVEAGYRLIGYSLDITMLQRSCTLAAKQIATAKTRAREKT